MMYKASFVGGFFMGQKTKKGRTSNKERIITAVVSGVATAVVLLLAYSLMVEKSIVSIKTLDTAVIVINIISSAVCGTVAGASAGEGRGIRVSISCLIFALAVIAFSLATAKGGTDMHEIVRIFLCGLSGLICGIFLRLGKSNKKLRKRTKHKN